MRSTQRVDFQARGQTQLTGMLSVVGLGFLSLVPVVIVLIAQTLQIGFGLTLASSVPISDSNVWSGCASELSKLTTPENLGWCLKRPNQMFLQSPFFLASPNSMGGAIVLQTLVLSGLMWWLLISIRRTLPVTRLAVWIVYLASIWPIVLYGTQFATESPALGLSLVSVAFLLNFLGSRRFIWGFASVATALLAYQLRPGNLLLTLLLALGLLVFAWKVTRRWLLPALLTAGFVAVWWLPNQVMRMVGWSEAGHSSNFWSVLYSAASPENDTWEASYVRFAKQVGCSADWNPDPCMGLESAKFAEILRDASFQLIRDNPFALPRQAFTNLTNLLDTGFLNLMWVNPFPTAWNVLQPDYWQGGNALGVITASLLWVAASGLIGLIVLALVKWRRNPSWREGRLERFGVRGTHRLFICIVLGLVTIVGSIAFFALVGHDEPQRHMVQNIPFVLLALAAVVTIFSRHVKVGSKSLVARTAEDVFDSVWSKLGLGMLVAVISLGAIIEGHTAGQTLTIKRSCSNEKEILQEYIVIGKARWNAQTIVQGPSDWRVLQGRSTQSFPSGFSWPQSQVNVLPPGNIMTMRSTTDGNIIPVFLSDSLNVGASTSMEPVVWCTQIPSQYDSMIVHDLQLYIAP